MSWVPISLFYKLSIFVNTYRKWTILPKQLIAIKYCRIAFLVFRACSRRPNTCWIDAIIFISYWIALWSRIWPIQHFLVRPRRRIFKIVFGNISRLKSNPTPIWTFRKKSKIFHMTHMIWVNGNNEGEHLSKRSNWLQFPSKRCRSNQRGLSDDL